MAQPATIGTVGILQRGVTGADGLEPPDRNRARLQPVFQALAAARIAAESVVFDEGAVENVRRQLAGLDGVLVWVDPIVGERDRRVLDDLLREVAATGVWVSTHPDVIERLGTKEVLVRTRDLPFGSDTYLYRTPGELRTEFPERVARDGARVLKRDRGNAGIGVWKVRHVPGGQGDPTVEVQHAHPRGVDAERLSLADFMHRVADVFASGGCLVDQPFLPRITEGMVRCYMVLAEVVGFARQTPNEGQLASGRVFGLPSDKTMYEASDERFAALRNGVELEWLPKVRQALRLDERDMPMLWDADFLYGPKDAAGNDTFVLCEINVSSVLPFPSAVPAKLAEAVRRRLTPERR